MDTLKNPLRDSVARLLQIANSGTGASQAAASVLLAAYNIYQYRVDVGELCLLDEAAYQCAKNVLDWRVIYGNEPHHLIENGEQRFEQLCQDWQHLKRVPF
ncbi:DUF7673 family protein [Gilvimarinus japonicus]|uniref:DUF7673 domain-containing protein n=1 Tax=Gilvimarinus japonicus TaxID=1796469 RepID=A0ABV7HT60_9GAMM